MDTFVYYGKRHRDKVMPRFFEKYPKIIGHIGRIGQLRTVSIAEWNTFTSDLKATLRKCEKANWLYKTQNAQLREENRKLKRILMHGELKAMCREILNVIEDCENEQRS